MRMLRIASQLFPEESCASMLIIRFVAVWAVDADPSRLVALRRSSCAFVDHSFVVAGEFNGSALKGSSLPPCSCRKASAASWLENARTLGEHRSNCMEAGCFCESVSTGCCRQRLTSLPCTRQACSGAIPDPVSKSVSSTTVTACPAWRPKVTAQVGQQKASCRPSRSATTWLPAWRWRRQTRQLSDPEPLPHGQPAQANPPAATSNNQRTIFRIARFMAMTRDAGRRRAASRQCCWTLGARDRSRTGTEENLRRILSPLRLPISPPRHTPLLEGSVCCSHDRQGVGGIAPSEGDCQSDPNGRVHDMNFGFA